MKPLVWMTTALVVAGGLQAPAEAAPAALDSLVANERAFAALAAARGEREAFLTYLAEDAVIFEPTATPGRQAWEARPEPASSLLWEPSFAAVSSAGDLGYTTGPWEVRPPPDSTGVSREPQAYGHFVSVWKKRKGGGWRVVADIGISHPRPPRGGLGSGEFDEGPRLPIRTMKGSRVDLAAEDRRLAQAMRALGAHEAVATHAAQDLRLNVEGRWPTLGIEAAQAHFDSLLGFLRFWTQGSGVASSGDLGYTYGWAERFPAEQAAADSSVYLHVWRQDDGRTWELALAVHKPLNR